MALCGEDETLGDMADARIPPGGRPGSRTLFLMLLRRQADSDRLLLAERLELADRVPERGQLPHNPHHGNALRFQCHPSIELYRPLICCGVTNVTGLQPTHVTYASTRAVEGHQLADHGVDRRMIMLAVMAIVW